MKTLRQTHTDLSLYTDHTCGHIFANNNEFSWVEKNGCKHKLSALIYSSLGVMSQNCSTLFVEEVYLLNVV